jgi:phosphate transport system substrate-binding protein
MRVKAFWRALMLVMLSGCAGTAQVSAQGTPSTPAAQVQPYQPRAELNSLDGVITADGSSTVFPITDEAAIRFKDLAGDVRISVEFSGTSSGFEKFCKGEIDIQDASRPIEHNEIDACAANGIQYYEFEVGYDGITIAVNPKNDFVTCLTVDQLKRLWQPDDNADTWRDLDPNWPDREIELYGPGPASGTFDYFTAAIVGEEDVSRTDYFPSENDLDLVLGVADRENGLGYFGFAYYEQNQDQLKSVAVDASAGCVSPSPQTIADGSYKPLSRPLFVYVKAESLQRPEVQEFVRFYIATAQQIATEVGYVAAPSAIYVEGQTKAEGAIAGTIPPDGPE